MEGSGGKAAHRSTQRVLDILSTLSEADKGMTMTEICRVLDAPKSSLFPILHTMADAGFVSFDTASGRYDIGMRSYLLGATYERRGGRIAAFKASMRQVVDACDETCQLGTLERGRVLYVAKVDSTQPVHLRSSIGKTLGASYTAIGKALLAEMTNDEARQCVPVPLEVPTPRAPATMDALIDELAQVRETGFAYDNEEATEGVRCIAVSVCKAGGTRYAMSVTTPSYRLTPDKEQAIRSALAQAKHDLELLFS